MSQLETSAGLSFGVSVVRGGWAVLIGGRLRPSLPLAPRGHSSVGRAPSLQGGCRRFESGWLHSFRPLARRGGASDEMAPVKRLLGVGVVLAALPASAPPATPNRYSLQGGCYSVQDGGGKVLA